MIGLTFLYITFKECVSLINFNTNTIHHIVAMLNLNLIPALCSFKFSSVRVIYFYAEVLQSIKLCLSSFCFAK